jgi:hypothetical protein
MRAMQIERYEALGQRGEACIVIAEPATLPNGESSTRYRLATGERLTPMELPGHFATLDGRRSFRLRQPRAPKGDADGPPTRD